MLEIFKYALLGLIQGFTEPIPISSSGHLVIFEHLFGIHPEGLGFEVLVNFASLLAVLLVYRRDLIELAAGGLRYVKTRDKRDFAEFRFILFLIIATVPAGLIGVLFGDFIGDNLKRMATLGWTLLVTGVALWLIRNMRGRKHDGELTFKDAIIIGLAQAVALIPGISRSGATIVAAMGLGMRQETSLRFSFFLFIPISLGAMVLEGSNMLRDPRLVELVLPYSIAFVGSLVASYYSLRWFIHIMARGNLKYFAYYCFAAGLAVLLFLA